MEKKKHVWNHQQVVVLRIPKINEQAPTSSLPRGWPPVEIAMLTVTLPVPECHQTQIMDASPIRTTGLLLYPIGSMYAIYGNIYHQYTPFMLAYIPAPWILWVLYIILMNRSSPHENSFYCWSSWGDPPELWWNLRFAWVTSPSKRDLTTNASVYFLWLKSLSNRHVLFCVCYGDVHFSMNRKTFEIFVTLDDSQKNTQAWVKDVFVIFLKILGSSYLGYRCR